jgi:hypothetical protein
VVIGDLVRFAVGTLVVGLLGWTATTSYAQKPLREAQSSVGYASVAEAQRSLRSKSGVEFEVQRGWLVATDKPTLTIWSLSPKGYPAYPAVVKRQVVQVGPNVNVNMSILCEAGKQDCDDLVRTFASMNGFQLPD